MKDLRTRRVILRYNSDGDLYTLTAATPATAHALAPASSSLWHRHLGHPALAAILPPFARKNTSLVLKLIAQFVMLAS